MLFLGAGASVPLGIMDLSGITEMIRNELPTNLRLLIERINSIFEKSQYCPVNFRLDIEVVYTIFDSLLNRQLILNDLGPVGILMHTLLESDDAFSNFKISEEDFRSFQKTVADKIFSVIDAYNRNEEKKIKAKKLYDKLYEFQRDNNTNVLNALGGNSYSIFDLVATLNYDLVLENYSRNRRHNDVAIPHFVDRRGLKMVEGLNYLNLSEIKNGDTKLQYIKLHGSIDWWENEDGRIIEYYHDFNPYENLRKRLIIYPIYEKHISREPFFTLYQYFRNRLMEEDITLIIGYSFRDPSINNAFIDWLYFNGKARLIIVCKYEYQHGIRNIFENQGSRLEFIEEYFGEDGFTDSLKELLTQSPDPGRRI